MNVDNFLTFFNGIYCDFDGAYGDQCFDLANGYSRWIGGPRFTGATADLIINQAGTFYTRIDNTPTGFPIKGDIIVWNWPHVAVATGDNTDKNSFDCLEQNDPTGSDCHLKHYANYNGVLGWLRPINLPQGTDQVQLDELRKARDDNWNLYQGEVAKNGELTKQIQDLQQQLQNLRDAFDKQTQADAATGKQLLDVSHERDSYKITINNIAKALNTLSDEKSILGAIGVLKQPIEQQVKPVQDYALSLQKALENFITNKKYKSLLDKIKKWFTK